MLKHVYGTKDRIFVNTEIGCRASCKYCYMESILETNTIQRVEASKVIEEVKHIERIGGYVPGRENTIVSIGCYSECLFQNNIDDTIELIKYFTNKDNYIQIVTKQSIPSEVCEVIRSSRRFKNQINVYISMPTYSKIDAIEKGTVGLEERIKNIEICKENEINVVLYIKPFLESITLCDLDFYIDLIKKYKTPVIVGNYLSVEKNDVIADVGEKKLYEKKKLQSMTVFMNEIAGYTDVYSHSTEYIEYLRKGEHKDGAGNTFARKSNYNSIESSN